jgi:uncharacterized membrane protein
MKIFVDAAMMIAAVIIMFAAYVIGFLVNLAIAVWVVVFYVITGFVDFFSNPDSSSNSMNDVSISSRNPYSTQDLFLSEDI